MKKFLITIILFGFLACIVYGYVWYRNIMRINREAIISLPKAQGFDALKNAVTLEQNRCQEFVTKSGGNFDEFTYCKKFVEWSKTLTY
ncbi:MAG: hypothetical protein ABI758_04515 [Candidatus Woesebacteria bacterium]